MVPAERVASGAVKKATPDHIGDFPVWYVTRRRDTSKLVICMLQTEHRIVHCLVTYTDWWQPPTGSVLQVGAARRNGERADGFAPGVLETLDERTEICRRVWELDERDRRLLFYWYVEQSPVEQIAQSLGVSRRQCYRRRARAIQTIIDLGSGEEHS